MDFWRVEALEVPTLLRLRAEMKLPGRAWLEFEVERDGAGCTLRQTAVFDPAGLAGLVYWYGIYPLHALVFCGILSGIAREAARGERTNTAKQDRDAPETLAPIPPVPAEKPSISKLPCSRRQGIDASA